MSYLPTDSLQLFSLCCWIAALLTVPSVLLQRRSRPIAALSWLLALFAMAPVALLAWWLFGRTHLRRKRRRRRQASQNIECSLLNRPHRLLSDAARSTPDFLLAPWLPLSLKEAIFPVTGDNHISLQVNTAEIHQCWEQMITAARQHVHLLFYIWNNDQTGRKMRELLCRKAREGVEVRVLYDALGCLTLPPRFFTPLRTAGCQVVAFMPIKLITSTPTINFRNHRKLIICDAQSAWTGGVNVGDEYLDWQDIGVQLHGPVINHLQEVFIEDWYFSCKEELSSEPYFFDPDQDFHTDIAKTEHGIEKNLARQAECEIIASGPHQKLNAMREMVFLAITQCQQRLWIATPYFVPDTALQLALRTAVYRGVDVRLYVPARSDVPLVRRASRFFYPELLEGGVKIYEYQGMLHAKMLLMDNHNTLLGSANLDTRSFRLNFELSTFIHSTALNQDLARLFQRIEQRCQRLGLKAMQGHSMQARLKDALAHLLSPLL